MTDAETAGFDHFVDAQEVVWPNALAELRAGAKRGHWMWFIFPQIDGLGTSAMARAFAIHSRGEARAYLDHPVLGTRLREAAAAVLTRRDRSAVDIMGGIDALKLRSSMTLFSLVADDPAPFDAVLAALYDGERDGRTVALLG